MAPGNNITINISTAAIIKVVGVFLILSFIYLIRDILITVFIAIIFAALIDPLVNRLEKKKIPRAVAIILIYVLVILFLALVVRLLIPPFAQQISSLSKNFPSFWDKVLENFESVKEYSQEQGYLDDIQRGLQGIENNISRAASGAYALIIAVFRNVINFLLVLVVTFYLVMEKDAFGKILRAVTPGNYHDYVTNLAGRIEEKIGAWARGQLLLGLIIGLMSFLGLIFLLPKYALVLAIVAGLTELVPYLGPVLGAIPAVFLGLTVSLWHGIAILILYVAIQWLENNVVVPQVMKRQVGLNPVVIIVSMLIGARLVGIIGIILAVPVATSVGLVLKDFMEKSNITKIKPDINSQP